MNIKNLFFKPLDRAINGVVKADQDDDATVFQELDEYVVTNELEKHFRAFFESYSTDLSDPSIANRVGVWISGFFGSGKSHFLKILSYILANKESVNPDGSGKAAVDFFDEQKIRDAMIRADMGKAVGNPADVILFNIDSKASANDDGNKILNVFLRVFNEHQGFSGDHPHVAHMERHLAEKGVYDIFKTAFKDASGVDWVAERDGFEFYQDDVEKALSEALELSANAAKKWFEESESNFSVSVEKFCHWVKEYLDTQSPEHRLLFLVDEVGQFIGSDTHLMLTLQTITENLGTICKGRAWIIVTSQADMDAVLGELSSSKANDFSKIAGRFKTRLSLSSSNTDEVIQRRLLRKTEEADEALRKVWSEKGDILKNQLTFDRSGPTLKNFDGPESFVANYPFAPYHFQLVQKVFEEIRKVGASGAHLAYGERSMLDAFQMAARAISAKNIGALVPMHRFYDAVEGFLDTAVKRTIDNAAQNATLDDVDVSMLRTLFMIRYVDLVKGTLDNLVTLSIEQIDEDKLALRKSIEESLQRLEKESLITRNGDEFVFLTNEERDITRKIKATDIAGNEENKELGNLVFKDLLRDQNKYRYTVNKTDYSVGRYLDGHSLDGRYESDLRFEVVSPLDVDYAQCTDAGCINKSGEGEGIALLKLPDDKTFFSELRTWLKTNKFIRLNDDASQADQTRILADRGRENQERKKRLRASLEEMLAGADIYALGQHLGISSTSIATKFDEANKYLLENTYTKLAYLKVLQQEPMRELQAVLTVDDIGQMGLELDGEQGNPLATKEVDQYVALKTSGTDRTLVSDIVERFNKRPYGWPDAEILLILGRLAAAGKISLQMGGGTLPVNEAFEPLSNSRRRREVSVIRKRQTDEAMLKQAHDLTRKLFSAMGPSAEKELFAFYLKHFGEWLANLKSYKSKVDVGRFPGKSEIEAAILRLERLFSHSDSFDFFKELVDNKDDYLDLEEDYRELHEFFSNQIHTWQQLQAALANFEKNKRALEKDEKAKSALDELRDIESSAAPFGMLHRVAVLVADLETANNAIVAEKRDHALARVDAKIAQVQEEIAKSGIATPDLSNRLLSPLQRVRKGIEAESSISTIYMLQAQTAGDELDFALEGLRLAIQAEAEKQKPKPGDQGDAPGGEDDEGKPTPPVVVPKEAIDIAAAEIFSHSNSGVYLETQEEAEQFISDLREEVMAAVKANKRIRIR
jgi:hypothetical protein